MKQFVLGTTKTDPLTVSSTPRISIDMYTVGIKYMNIVVSGPRSYSGKTGGLCGNMNDNTADDMKLRPGVGQTSGAVTNTLAMEQSWKIPYQENLLLNDKAPVPAFNLS